MLDESEFLSPYGVRALSQAPRAAPVLARVSAARDYAVSYEPGESDSGMFGGNSNWRGPDLDAGQLPPRSSRCRSSTTTTAPSFTVECPTGSGQLLTLGEVADELSRRLCRLFLRGAEGRRASLRRPLHVPATIRIAATTASSTSTSTATRAGAPAPRIRRVGPAWSRSCSLRRRRRSRKGDSRHEKHRRARRRPPAGASAMTTIPRVADRIRLSPVATS